MYVQYVHVLFASNTEQQPFHEWVTEATSDVKSLFPVELDKEKLAKAKEKLERIQQDARDREEEVTAICTLADAFDEKRKVCVWGGGVGGCL